MGITTAWVLVALSRENCSAIVLIYETFRKRPEVKAVASEHLATGGGEETTVSYRWNIASLRGRPIFVRYRVG